MQPFLLLALAATAMGAPPALAPGFELAMVAAEPLVRQPVAIDLDDRGRIWVMQYLQYPNPEGLRRVAVDRYSRTRYDRVPEPPPRGPKGADRLTILEDSDGDGRPDKGRDFISGLNLASGFVRGHGGVFVLNVPYLLFYPDRDGDDVPDANPDVLLAGFGMEDAHSVANSLTWGPDGWLYGCQGSTVTAEIRGIRFQQGVWRYHPVTREFELFCEGGGNAWGLDFDPVGRLFYSTNHGGHVMVHGVQGASYTKAFAKHGELRNPYAYGWFEHAPHRGFKGGHVTVGGIVYQETLFPRSFRGKYMAADLLGHGVYWHEVKMAGSAARTAHGGEILLANDNSFAPTDLVTGPDGAVYVSDWRDERTAHPDPDAQWDKTNGRIYRIAPQGAVPTPWPDVRRLGVSSLAELHGDPRQWVARRARLELASRCNAKPRPGRPEEWSAAASYLLDRASAAEDEVTALGALWSLNAVGGFSEAAAERLLASRHPHIRSWTIRLLGDSRQVSAGMAHRLDKHAEKEPHAEVRLQLAATAARLPSRQALPVINANINRDADGADPFIPLMWWWAVEAHAETGREEVMKRFLRPSAWKSALFRETLLPRLVRRYASGAKPGNIQSASLLIASAPDAMSRQALWDQVLMGLAGMSRSAMVGGADWRQDAEVRQLALRARADWLADPRHPGLTRLALLLRVEGAAKAVETEAFDTTTPPERRAFLLGFLAGSGDRTLAGKALEYTMPGQPERVRLAAVGLVASLDQVQASSALADRLRDEKSAVVASAIRAGLLSSKPGASALLGAVDSGRVGSSAIPIDELRAVATLASPELDALVRKHWGVVGSGTPGERLAEVRRLENDLRAGHGDPGRGKELFKAHCAACHVLFGEGTKGGPDLTTANRQDRRYLLESLVDPSGTIRREYASVVVATVAGRVHSGLPLARDQDSITLLVAGSPPVSRKIPLAEVESISESPLSIMPENLHKAFSPQGLRDLFAHIQKKP